MRWLLMIALFSNQVFARTVLVQGRVSDLDYRAELRARADLISPIEAHARAHPGAPARENLIAVFSEAQKAFLESAPPAAAEAFRRVRALLLTEDWAASDLEIFLAADLRLAQLSEGPAEVDRLLSESLALGEDVGFDSSLYPPPLLERRAALAHSVPKGNPARALLSKDFPVILLNGRACDQQKCENFPLTGGRVRLTFLSNRDVAQTEILDLKDVAAARPKIKLLAEGACESVKWSTEAGEFTERKLFSGPCGLKPIAFARLVPSKPSFSTPEPTTVVADAKTEAPEHVPFYKNKWVWIGVGVLAAGVAAVALTARPHESKDPTVTYGYKN